MAKPRLASHAPAAHHGLARLIHAIRFEDLPSDVVRFAKALVLDSIGCLIGGLEGAPAEAVRRIVGRAGARPASTVLGTPLKTTASLAAFANGTALRYLDFNDSYRSGWKSGSGHNTAHPSGNLPVALAVGEGANRSGRDLVAALVGAYEIHLRLCDHAGQPSLRQRGWHNTINLAFSSAALAARLSTDDAAITSQAIAISATHQNTLAELQEGSLAAIKATADGWVAKGGIEAAELAAEGLTGPDEIFEGKSGWGKAVAGGIDYEGLLEPINGEYRIMRSRIKPFAAVGPAMAPIQAAVDLYETGRIRPERIAKVTVALPQLLFDNPATGEPRRYPESKEAADHSLFYCVAIALLEGNCGEAQYAPEKLKSRHVRDLLAKVDLVVDPEFTGRQGEVSGGGVGVTLEDGTVLEKRYPLPPGHPTNPLGDEHIARKFDGLTARFFSAGQRDAIKTAIRDLDRCERISDLTALLARSGE